MLVKTTYSRTNFETLDQRNFKKISTTLRHLFHIISEFEKILNGRNNVLVKDTTDRRKNAWHLPALFAPKYNSAIMEHQSLNENTVQYLLNKLHNFFYNETIFFA